MEEVEAQATARTRFEMLLMTVFGCSALLLAAIGIYGLMAYSVQQRTHEIGIRMALGAESRSVRNMVLLQGVRLTLIGVATGRRCRSWSYALPFELSFWCEVGGPDDFRRCATAPDRRFSSCCVVTCAASNPYEPH